jgi:hypothetical protein
LSSFALWKQEKEFGKLKAMVARDIKNYNPTNREKHGIEVSRIHVTFGHKKNESCFWGCIGKKEERMKQAAAANNSSLLPVTLTSF